MCDAALSGVPLSNIVIKGNLTYVLELIDIFITHAPRHKMVARFPSLPALSVWST